MSHIFVPKRTKHRLWLMTIKSEVALTTLLAFIPTSYASQHSKRLQHFTEYNKIHITLSDNKIKSKQSVLAGLVQVYENNLISNHFRWWKSGFCSLWEGRHPSVIETVWFCNILLRPHNSNIIMTRSHTAQHFHSQSRTWKQGINMDTMALLFLARPVGLLLHCMTET